MRTASQLRQIARQRLDGKWGTSLAVSLLAALLGCYGTYFTVSYSVDSTGELFDGATVNLAALFRSLFGTDMEILVPLLSISAAIDLPNLLGLLIQMYFCLVLTSAFIFSISPVLST